jgi:ankyrin repeat protein
MLAAYGVDVNAKALDGDTVLHLAAYNGHARVCEVLVGLGADVFAVDGAGGTAGELARSYGHAALSTRLVTMERWERGGDGVDEGRLEEIAREIVGDGLCGYGAALVGVGIEGGSAALVRRGVAGGGGVDLNGKMWDGKMSIEYAIRFGDNVEVVEALIEGGADANYDGGSHLRDAAWKGRAGVCVSLIRAGADVNGVDADGHAALHLAAMSGHLEVCEVLVERGANVASVNTGSKTAAAFARERGREGIAAYLEEAAMRGVELSVRAEGGAA